LSDRKVRLAYGLIGGFSYGFCGTSLRDPVWWKSIEWKP
jgi:hypothetical protein